MKNRNCVTSLWMISAGALMMSSISKAALTFDFVYTGTWGDTQKTAMNSAAVLWSQYISDPITVKIEVKWQTGLGALASTDQNLLGYSYANIRNSMITDAADEGTNDTIVASLPSSLSATVPDNWTLQPFILTSQANLKALGVTTETAWVTNDLDWTVNDATITFDSSSVFDFDGILNGWTGYDFVTVAAHEIGHVLGFNSFVDFISGGPAGVYPTTLDLFRFADGDVTTGNFSSKSRNLTPATTAYFDDAAFEYAMSTGVTGDGRQASHWKDDALTSNHIGLMDPTIATGTFWVPTQADLRALDLIGYEFNFSPVPEVTSLSSGALLILGALRRRRSPRNVAAK